jgi:hypothetical protein
MDHEKFLRLTWYEWSLYLEGFVVEQNERDYEISDLKALIANCLTNKKGGGHWTWKDFSRLQQITNVPERKLTMKEAKKSLGGKWREPKNGN